MAEQLVFDIFATDRASSKFRSVGDAAAAASAKMDLATASMALWNDTAAKQGKAADASVAAMKSSRAASLLYADAQRVLAGESTKTTKLMADQGTQFEWLGKSAKNAAGAGGTSGLAALIGQGNVTGMGGLIAAGVALAPVIATVGTGLLGLGAAGYGIAKPILTAAQATGGLTANMHKLNPEQQTVARGLLALGQQFGAFQKQMQPAVFTLFNEGLTLAATLLHAVEPVAAATGKALGGVLHLIDNEFASGTWQQFFGFMANTAGPDVKLLGNVFVNLADALPPLIMALQPLATELLKDTAGAAKLIGYISSLTLGVEHLDLALLHASQNMSQKGFAGIFSAWPQDIKTAFGNLLPGIPILGKFQSDLHKLGENSGTAAKGLQDTGDTAAVSGPKFFSLNKAVAALNISMTALVGNLLTLQGDDIAWKQSLQAAQAQLKSNTAGLEGNSKNALANRAAVLASSNAALTFATQQLALGKNIDGASRTVQAQIKWLQGLHDKSQFVRDEIHALRLEEEKLQAQQINQTIRVQGLGQWSVSQSLAPGVGHRRATGGRVPGYGGGDRWPALLEGGEAIVPKHLTPMVAPFLRAHHVPGFAAGGLVASYTGSPAMAPWVKTDDTATIRLIDQAVVSATLAGMRAAQQSGFGGTPGPGGGAPAANAALAHRLYASLLTPAAWDAWNFVAMAESGWNQFARNPSSGAYGIPQALPPTKMPFAAQAAGGSNPMAQIGWMWNYMQASYGGPIGAAAHEASQHWYDRGGYLPPGASVAVNNTGRAERVSGPGEGAAMIARLDKVIALLEAAPGRHGAAVGDALNGVARSALYSGRYSSR